MILPSAATNVEPPALPRQALLSLLMAVLAASLLIGLFLSPKKDAALILGSLVLITLFLASGNQRLFCLWAVVTLAPFTLAKNFVLLPHMGGAGSFTIDAIDPFLLMLLFFMLRDMARGYRSNVRFSPLFLWWSGMILLGMLDAAFGALRMMAAEEVQRMIKCYVLFFVILNEVVRVRLFTHLLAALIAGMALQASTGILQGLFKINLGLQELGEATQETIQITSVATYAGGGDSGFRINGLLGHPNLLAAYLSMLLPICIALLFSRIPSKAKIPLGGVTAMGLLALMMTLSRTGWLTFGVAFALLYGLSFVHPRLRRRFLFARVAALGCMALVVVESQAGAVRHREGDSGAVEGREVRQRRLSRIADHALFGLQARQGQRRACARATCRKAGGELALPALPDFPRRPSCRDLPLRLSPPSDARHRQPPRDGNLDG